MTKECPSCGKTFETAGGWNNNINRILWCQECQAKRAALLADINTAITGKAIEVVYLSTEIFRLFSVDDFIVDYSPRKAEKMNGQLFQVVEVQGS